MIEDRDRICRHPSCHSTLGLEVHHIHHWEDGGVTDTHNLCMLCKNHHKRHHKHEFTIEGNANNPNGLTFRNNKGEIIDGLRQTATTRNSTTTRTGQTLHSPNR